MEGVSSSSSSEALLVRCPMCGNLLPELPDFPVYRCGGCGAVLRAKGKGLVEDGLSDISDDENGRVMFSKRNIAMNSDNLYETVERDNNFMADSMGSVKREPRQKRGMNFAPLESSPEYGTGDYRRNYDDGFSGFARVADLENDKAELLRKIGELKDQLRRTCDVSENPNERIALETRMASTPFDTYSSHDLCRPRLFAAKEQPLRQGLHVLGPIVQDSRGWLGMVPYNNGRSEEMVTRPYQEYRHSTQMYHNRCHDPYMDVDRGSLHKSPFQPPCSCSQCFNQNWEAHHVIPPPAIGNQRSHVMKSAPHAYTYEDFVPRNPRFYNQQWLTRRSSGHAQSKFDLGQQGPPRKGIIAHGSGEICRAISGGAPFITCCNCFELLKLPRKLRMMGKNQNKLRCGACSSIMLYELSGKAIILSVPKQIAKLSEELAVGLGDMSNKVEPFPANKKSNSDELKETQDAHSLSSSFSEHERKPVIVVGKDCPLHHSYISSDAAADRDVKVAKWSNEKEGQQNSVKDVTTATEMDISMNESVNSGVSLESFEASKDDDRSNNEKGSEPFLGRLETNTGELSKCSHSSEGNSSNVFVNGKLIPVPEVKRAQKLAGPIQLGEYWYDVRAGFWGVMGHPCFGIIPPNIEEFNYPMPKHCAAGNTGVFVNGRELHKKDLDILVSRGLGIAENKSYLIEISGKVVDEQTGEELDGLGKLAPTVERVGHGFGMKVPKWIAEES